MKRLSINMQVAAVSLVAAFAFGGSIAQERAKPMASKPAGSQSMAGHSKGSMELHRLMMEGKKMEMPMTGDVDRDFAKMMAMHHEKGMAMSKLYLEHGKDEKMKAAVKHMMEAHKEEMRMMMDGHMK